MKLDRVGLNIVRFSPSMVNICCRWMLSLSESRCIVTSLEVYRIGVMLWSARGHAIAKSWLVLGVVEKQQQQ